MTVNLGTLPPFVGRTLSLPPVVRTGTADGTLIGFEAQATEGGGHNVRTARSILVHPNQDIDKDSIPDVFDHDISTPERTLISHYYRHILDREPDQGGLDFWDGENQRLRNKAVESKEAYIVMAVYFFNNQEYLNRNTTNAAYIGHLYRTFFNREADDSGLNYWLGQIAAGMPRDIVLFNFLFSTEFNEFMKTFLTDNPSRAEVLAVMDYYRGIVNRIPESAGLDFWVGQFRQAQCAGVNEVNDMANSISMQFFGGAEYQGRNRSNAEFVSDLYNAFMRRGGDLDGVTFWIDQLTSGAQTREQLRQAFLGSTEFGGRIDAIVNESCMP